MKKSYLQIQDEVIAKYKIVIVENSSCWGRTHAHTDGTRRVCKWKRANSLSSTFTLLHEVGHIMTFKSSMRRCESEYYATIWALEICKEYGIKPNERTIRLYQNYIDREKQRGLNRHGSGYRDNYNLLNYDPSEIIELKVKEPKPIRIKERRFLI